MPGDNYFGHLRFHQMKGAEVLRIEGRDWVCIPMDENPCLRAGTDRNGAPSIEMDFTMTYNPQYDGFYMRGDVGRGYRDSHTREEVSAATPIVANIYRSRFSAAETASGGPREVKAERPADAAAATQDVRPMPVAGSLEGDDDTEPWEKGGGAAAPVPDDDLPLSDEEQAEADARAAAEAEARERRRAAQDTRPRRRQAPDEDRWRRVSDDELEESEWI